MTTAERPRTEAGKRLLEDWQTEVRITKQDKAAMIAAIEAETRAGLRDDRIEAAGSFTAWDLGQLTRVHIPSGDLEPMAASIRAHFAASPAEPGLDVELEAMRFVAGPIQHDTSMCGRAFGERGTCDCWCAACERHNAAIENRYSHLSEPKP